jgi:membrane-associated protease RseP (regulator of RpoE activity)
VFPGLPENEVVIAHPLLFAGMMGLTFSFWQVLPAGRFDGGRVIYGLFGRKRALVLSWVTIASLALLSAISSVWFGLAAFASLTLIRLKRQHPSERHTQELDAPTIALACALLAVLVLTFVPVPVRATP